MPAQPACRECSLRGTYRTTCTGRRSPARAAVALQRLMQKSIWTVYAEFHNRPRMPRTRFMRKRTSNGLPEDEAALFRDAVRDATPLESSARVGSKTESPPPVPIQSLLDGHDALVESLAGALSWDQSMETGEEPSYLRTGLARDVLRKLRRGHWVVQDIVDLHW